MLIWIMSIHDSYLRILEASRASDDPVWCLSSVETRWHFSMLLLTLVTTARRLSLSTSRTATAPYALVVRAFVVGERGENRGVS